MGASVSGLQRIVLKNVLCINLVYVVSGENNVDKHLLKEGICMPPKHYFLNARNSH